MPQTENTGEIAVTRANSHAVVRSSETTLAETEKQLPSSSHVDDVLEDPEFWREYLNDPAHDIAEAIIRLRRLRGITQDELAQRLATQQPSIARIEGGRANVGAELLRRIANALDAIARVDIEPFELVCEEHRHPRWWDRVVSAPVINPVNVTINIQNNYTTVQNLSVTIAEALARATEAPALLSMHIGPPLHSRAPSGVELEGVS